MIGIAYTTWFPALRRTPQQKLQPATAGVWRGTRCGGYISGSLPSRLRGISRSRPHRYAVVFVRKFHHDLDELCNTHRKKSWSPSPPVFWGSAQTPKKPHVFLKPKNWCFSFFKVSSFVVLGCSLGNCLKKVTFWDYITTKPSFVESCFVAFPTIFSKSSSIGSMYGLLIYIPFSDAFASLSCLTFPALWGFFLADFSSVYMEWHGAPIKWPYISMSYWGEITRLIRVITLRP